MTDPRCAKLAKLLIEYSTTLKKGERVLFDLIDLPDESGVELIRAARAAGATPVLAVRHTRLNRALLRESSRAHAEPERDLEVLRMKRVQAYLCMRGSA